MSAAETEVLDVPMRTHDGFSREEIIEMARELKITPEELEPQWPRITLDNEFLRRFEYKDGIEQTILKFQDAKYGITEEAHGRGVFLCNIETGKEVPRDEPVFILRAQDKYAIAAIQEYCRLITGAGTAHREMTGPTAHAAVEAFTAFSQAHPDRMKDPD